MRTTTTNSQQYPVTSVNKSPRKERSAMDTNSLSPLMQEVTITLALIMKPQIKIFTSPITTIPTTIMYQDRMRAQNGK
jgi:hypothetical protein